MSKRWRKERNKLAATAVGGIKQINVSGCEAASFSESQDYR